MSLPEAIKGLSQELQEAEGPLDWLERVLNFLRLVVSEVVIGTLKQIPYGARALRTYRWTCDPGCAFDIRSKRPTLHRDVRYSDDAERCVLDLYVPPTGDGGIVAGGHPVVLFCHGGVWASGDKWHYAPMATRLAQAGAVVGVIHYSLYPEALAPEMVEEVGSALTWAMDNAAEYGGDPRKVSLVGHSAGAHLCSLVLLKRAVSAGAREVQEEVDTRMPMQFIGMAGVYDISSHYDYEDARRVAKISTMARAMGGRRNFPDLSPSNILARASFSDSMDEELQEDDAPCTSLLGEPLSRRMGLDHDPALPLPQISPFDAELPEFCREDASKLPPMLLMSGMRDTTVPWYETAEFALRLRDLGAATKKLTYKTADHGTFVTGWKALLRDGGHHDALGGEDLPDACRDVMTLVVQGPERVVFPPPSPAAMSGWVPFGSSAAAEAVQQQAAGDSGVTRTEAMPTGKASSWLVRGPSKRSFCGRGTACYSANTEMHLAPRLHSAIRAQQRHGQVSGASARRLRTGIIMATAGMRHRLVATLPRII